jgi:hypothetical protein
MAQTKNMQQQISGFRGTYDFGTQTSMGIAFALRAVSGQRLSRLIVVMRRSAGRLGRGLMNATHMGNVGLAIGLWEVRSRCTWL